MPYAASRSREHNLKWLQKRLNVKENHEFIERSFTTLGQKSHLFYMEGLSSGNAISDYILRPLLRSTETASGKEARELVMNRLLEASAVRCEKDLEKAVQDLMGGVCLLLIDTVDEILVIDTRSYVHRPISSPMTENVVEGPHEAFNETLRDNLTLLHRKMQTASLICKIMSVGKAVSTQISLCYLDGVCKQETITELTRRLEEIDVDMVQSSGMLEQLIEDSPYAPFPQVGASERPDRIISFLLEGQAVVFIDGSPRALAMPVSFWHIVHAPDENAMRWQYGTFTRIMRTLGLVFALALPAVFVTVVIFHPLVIPMTLLMSIAESRANLPISLFGEAVLMLTLFDLVDEAHAHVPSLMGSSLGLVSALILGSAAVQASLISPMLIIVVAVSGLGSYALPNYSLGFTFRMLQLLLLLMGWVMGMAGVLFGMFMLLCGISGMTSLNQPFLAPNSPKRAHNPDLILVPPIYRQRLRSYLSNPQQMLRTKGRMRFRGSHKGGNRS